MLLRYKNAINIGVGFSYDLSGILKNGTNVKIAQNRALELQYSEGMLTDYIKIQVQQAMEDYELAIKQRLYTMKQLNKLLKTIELSKTNTITYQTLMISRADVEQLGSQINKALAKANNSKILRTTFSKRTIKSNLQSFKI
jgi:hypothetical protein